jgi:aspartate beta-hydroxylase
MSKTRPTVPDTLLEQARALAVRGEMLQAESLCLRALQARPDDPGIFLQLAEMAALREDAERAVTLLSRAHALAPAQLAISLKLVRTLWAAGDLQAARTVLERSLGQAARNEKDLAFAWLLLGELRRLLGNEPGSARAWHQATARTPGFQQWAADPGLPTSVRDLTARAIEVARMHRREHLQQVYAHLRVDFDAGSLARIDETVRALTENPPLLPRDARQRPKFLYVPGLPATPFLDPDLVPWAGRLREAFPTIRREALDLFESREPIPSFIDFDPGERMGEYLGGLAEKPAWDAFFFYRRGARFDANHRRCPETSEVLESLDLFRVAGQAPEICFSYLAPHTTIMPHHGVSNIRLVMHLPLRVPPDCELRLVGIGEHRWREGELLLFDDTYLHEASNRSDETRIVLLMDCWNPHLTATERAALVLLIGAIGDFEQAL